MKDKKKVGLVKRIASFLCALVVAVSCLGVSVPYFASEYVYNFNSCLDDISTWDNLPNFDGLLMDYPFYVTTRCNTGEYYLFLASDASKLYIREGGTGARGIYLTFEKLYLFRPNRDTSWSSYASNSWFVLKEENEKATGAKIGITNVDLYFEGNLVIPANVGGGSNGSYNSSLGYLQNVHRKNLTLDGENYDPDYDSWQVMFSFDSTSTSGLDITTGGYSVRHFMNWEVRDKDSNVIRTYDKVSCGEYDAASCKISYPLYSTRYAAMDECGFEALSWWESSVLGYEVYIYDYLQLVRTNADGSVEYGGYVRIDENGYVVDTLDENFAEDPNGYLDQDLPSSSGSGSNYEDAEHDADKNASNSSDSNTDLLSQINVLTSVIKAVPELIMEVFSFLPDWCLDMVGVAFTLSIMITIYKLAT